MSATTTTKTVTFKGPLGVRELSTYVDPHPGAKATDKVATDCSRCVDRRGYIRAFSHVYNGICFKCNGRGTESITVATVRKHAKEAAYRVEYAGEIQARRDEQRELFRIAAEAEAKAAEEAARVAEEARLASLTQGFIGQVDEKVTVIATIKVAKYISGTYNRSSSMFVVAETESGHTVKLFGSSQTLFGLERGDKATLTGKVKKHESYNGQDQTVLGFVKAVKIEEVEA